MASMQKLKEVFGDSFRQNLPLKNFTTVQIGGPAKAFLTVKTQKDLILAVELSQEENIPYLILGGGSNLLVTDNQVNKLVIKNQIAGLALQVDGLRAYSGTPLQLIVNFTTQNGLSGIQKLTGIPGTLGGAIFGNAGAYGQAVGDYISEVVCFDPQKKALVTLSQKECGFDYRYSNFKKNQLIILEAKFRLQPQNPEELIQQSRQVLQDRLAKYPGSLKCPGSFFKNVLANNLSPEILKLIPQEKITNGKISAGYLLESVGARGQKLGGIKIADTHGNLFINEGDGTAEQFYQLAQTFAQKVKEKFDITLEPEVQLLGLPPLTG